MARCRDQEVVRLDVSVNAVQCVGFLDTDNHLGNIEARNWLAENILSDEKTKKVSAGHVIHDEVKIGSILEAGDQWYDPGAVVSGIHSSVDVFADTYHLDPSEATRKSLSALR